MLVFVIWKTTSSNGLNIQDKGSNVILSMHRPRGKGQISDLVRESLGSFFIVKFTPIVLEAPTGEPDTSLIRETSVGVGYDWPMVTFLGDDVYGVASAALKSRWPPRYGQTDEVNTAQVAKRTLEGFGRGI